MLFASPWWAEERVRHSDVASALGDAGILGAALFYFISRKATCPTYREAHHHVPSLGSSSLSGEHLQRLELRGQCPASLVDLSTQPRC